MVGRRYTLDTIPEDLLFWILNFLTVKEICQVSSVNKLLFSISESDHVWKDNLLRNYRITPNITTTNPDSDIFAATNNMKLMYKEEKARIKSATAAISLINKEFAIERKTESYSNVIGSILDITQIYILIPLTVICVILSIILIALKLDNSALTVLDCFIPLLILVVYVIFCCCITGYLYYYNDLNYSVFNGIWQRMESPIKFITEPAPFWFNLQLITVCLLLITFLVLLALKLTPSSPVHLTPWGVVFLPVWVLFLSYLSRPCVQCSRDKLVYFMILFFVWLPLLVLCICVTERLESVDHYTRPNYARMKYAIQICVY